MTFMSFIFYNHYKINYHKIGFDFFKYIFNTNIFYEHYIEFSYRLYGILIIIFLNFFCNFLNIKSIIKFYKYPIIKIKLFQILQNEYVIYSFLISLYNIVFFIIPVLYLQFLLYILPLFKKTITIFKFFLFFISLFFFGFLSSYLIFIPKIFLFFLTYSEHILEPFWSFNQYIMILFNILYNTEIICQIPLIQFILVYLKIISKEALIGVIKYIFLFSTIISAIITSSTDPLNQILLSFNLIFIYLFGIIILFFFKI
uniref:Sec-independent protein translocase component n=1 Tax=Nitzschia sp. IriIs04 TaxID=1444690 RepID=A0A0S3QPK0_9STRA|nr:Sec-independent protein translocase component [Nitzschia sp. IriIs04]BAT70258.1 Sec-independent protein translocase component [Nitzschia sp. IriIs04]